MHKLLSELTVSRQKAKNLTLKTGKMSTLPSTVKKAAVIISSQTVSRSFKSHYFSCSYRTAGSQRIFLTGTNSFHVLKHIHFTAFLTYLRLFCQYNWLPSESTSVYKRLMINCIDENKKSALANRQP